MNALIFNVTDWSMKTVSVPAGMTTQTSPVGDNEILVVFQIGLTREQQREALAGILAKKRGFVTADVLRQDPDEAADLEDTLSRFDLL